MTITINKNLISRNHSTLKRNKADIKYIVIHYVGALGDAKANTDYYKNNDVSASADFFVGHSGDIWQANDYYNYYSWHCGGGLQGSGGASFFGKCTNRNSIGIEMCVKKRSTATMNATDKDWYFTDATIKSTVMLVQKLMKELEIDADHVIRHYDVTGKLCVPTDVTELLTKEGWKKITDIKAGKEVAQFKPDGDIIEFAPVLNKVEPYEAEVLKCRKLEATANHRMYAKPNCVNSRAFKELQYGEMLDGGKQYIVKNGGFYHGAGIDLTDDELRLLVWTQADGYYATSKSKSKHYGLEFHFSKERKIKAVCELLERMHIAFKYQPRKDGTTMIRVRDDGIVEWCEKWLSDKEFTWKLLEMSGEQFDVFGNELLKADGRVDDNEYFSRKQINLDIVQALCAIHGKRVNKCPLGKGYDMAVVESKSNYSIGGCKKKVEKRNTTVSCVTVPSGFILIRQYGRTFIVGNCPNPFVYNTGTVTWTDFKAMISGNPSSAPFEPDETQVTKYYRVRTAWNDPNSQLGAYTVLQNAKDNCPVGYKVYDSDGKEVYHREITADGNLIAKQLTGSEAQKIAQVAPIYQACMRDTGMLASVGLAQFCLESGYGTTDLAVNANNMHGMKCPLSGNNWSGTTWDGKSQYTKQTAEQDENGNVYYINAAFRKYPGIKESVYDRAAYFIGAKNGVNLRYPGINQIKNAEEQVRLIKKGGYATDVNYVGKLLSIIDTYNLTKYDVAAAETEVKEEKKESNADAKTPAKTENKTNQEVDKQNDRAMLPVYVVQAGSYSVRKNAANLKKNLLKDGFEAIIKIENGLYKVQCGAFNKKENADMLVKKIKAAGYNAFAKER